MKAFITLAVVCLIASALASPLELNEDQKPKAKIYFEECIKQENISEEEAVKLRNKDFSSPSEKMKCFGTCFFEKVGSLKDNEVQDAVVIEKLGAIIGEEKSKAILEKCKNIKGNDRCDTGFKIYECFETERVNIMAA